MAFQSCFDASFTVVLKLSETRRSLILFGFFFVFKADLRILIKEPEFLERKRGLKLKELSFFYKETREIQN